MSELNGTKLRLYCGDEAISESDVPDLSFTPRVADNKESSGWASILGKSKPVTIDFSKMIPIEQPPIIDGEVDYYYRRGDKAFFRFNGRRITFQGEGVTSQLANLKRGVYPARFTFM